LQRNTGEGGRATSDIAGETPALQQRGLQLAASSFLPDEPEGARE
jgi:hypothetical protein